MFWFSEPSLTTWNHLIAIHYATPGNIYLKMLTVAASLISIRRRIFVIHTSSWENICNPTAHSFKLASSLHWLLHILLKKLLLYLVIYDSQRWWPRTQTSELQCSSGGKREDYQNCSLLYCVLKLCTVISTHRWAVLTVLWFGFCLTGPISLCVDLFVFVCVYFFVFVSYCICVVLWARCGGPVVLADHRIKAAWGEKSIVYYPHILL